MTGEICFTNISFRFRDDADELLTLENPNEPRTDEFTRDGQCRAIVEFTRE